MAGLLRAGKLKQTVWLVRAWPVEEKKREMTAGINPGQFSKMKVDESVKGASECEQSSRVRDSPTSAPKGAKNESVAARQILPANEPDIIKVLVCEHLLTMRSLMVKPSVIRQVTCFDQQIARMRTRCPNRF